MATRASAEFTSKIKTILESNGVTDPISEVIISDNGAHLQSITVNFEDGSDKKQLSLFARYPQPKDQGYAQDIKDTQSYQKEMAVFLEYIPAAREYCKSLGREKLMDEAYPKSYYGGEDMILFENLLAGQGISGSLDPKEKLDFEMAEQLLTIVAKHHAITYAMFQGGGGSISFFERFPKLIVDTFRLDLPRTLYNPLWENGIDAVIKILKNSEMVSGRTRIIDKFSSLKVADFLTADNSTLDMQRIRYVSRSVDVCFYLYTCVKPQVRREWLGELITTYLNALKDTANELGHKIILTFEELQGEIDRQRRFGFWQELEVAVGVGQGILKEVDVSEKWIKENPEECAKIAEKVIRYWKEYERFNSD